MVDTATVNNSTLTTVQAGSAVTLDDWRRAGHLFDKLPSNVQGLVRDKLSIPNVHRAVLLPDPKLSVLDLISTSLPPIALSNASYPQIPSNHTFFSCVLPNTDAEYLSRTLVPPRTIISSLLPLVKQEFLDGCNSVQMPGMDPLPLWIFQLWTNIQLVVEPARGAWATAIAWLTSPIRVESSPNHVRDILDALATFSWSERFNRLPKSTLARFLSREWLGDEQIDQLMFLLKDKVSFLHRNITILDTVHTRELLKAFQNRDSGAVYDLTASGFLQRFGSNLNATSEFGGIFHVNGNHWVVAAVDLNHETVVYADPTGGTEHDEVVRALQWFVSQHVPGVEEGHLDFETMPCTRQDLSYDSWNCGILSYNALSHFYLTEKTPLMASSHVDTDRFRMSILQEMIASYTSESESMFELALPLVHFKYPSLPPRSSSKEKKSSSLQKSINRPLSKSLKPSEPKKRKHKTSTTESNPFSVLAPVFQIKPLKPVEELRKRSKVQKLKHDDNQASHSHTETLSDVPTEDETTSFGRPRLQELDLLTVKVKTDPGKPRKYRCAGPGCSKTWAPRTRARVLRHTKSCLFLSRDLRRMASAASADHAPGALVTDKSFSSNTASSPPSTPSLASFTEHEGTSSLRASQCANPENFFGVRGRKETHRALDLAILKLFCAASLSLHVADLPEWKAIFQITSPSYAPASRNRLTDEQIMSEQEHVRKQVLAFLSTQRNLSLTFDGGDTRGGDTFYTIHVTTPSRQSFLIEGRECTRVLHTGAWISDYVLSVMEPIGFQRFSSISSDDTGNTHLAREILESAHPYLLNLPDPIHHLNNTMKEISQLPFFRTLIKTLRVVLRYFKKSKPSRAKLQDLRIKNQLGPGLESIGKTRFMTHYWSAESLRRSLPAIRELATSEEIDLPKEYQNNFTNGFPATLHFEILLNQYLAVGAGPARAAECLEAASTSAADVYLYWLAALAKIKDALAACSFPDEVAAQIRAIFIRRWRQFFVTGPTNVHLCALYLHPRYIQSSIFKNPNPLTFNITLPAKGPSTVPPGIKSPKTFLEVGKYLYHIGVNEVMHGSDPILTAFKTRPKAFSKTYQAQFTAYAQRTYPFAMPIGENQDPLDWWITIRENPNTDVLSAIAIKIFSATPTSMADERTMSAISLLNTARRNRFSVDTMVAMTQIKGYYRKQQKNKVRKEARPRPVLKFYDIQRMLRLLDGDEAHESKAEDSESDESDLECDHDEDAADNSSERNIEDPSALSVEDDDELDMASVELQDLLSDKPIVSSQLTKSVEDHVVAANSLWGDDEGSGGTFMLGDWV